ncbi:MAG: threonine synthase [Syntrophomonas sp.]|nr:threonine synthase [Syntrophomonas sp.]
MKYESSRGKYHSVTAAEAIKMGISPDGGLFVPESIPHVDDKPLTAMASGSYQEKAFHIIRQFLSDFSDDEIKSCINGAYNQDNFDMEKIAPLVKLDTAVYIQELWHGPTAAFKDMALQILPHLLTISAHKTGEKAEIVILVATSGDTGKAALEGFKDVEGTKIIVFYPDEGVSEIQKRQMLTQEGNNVYVAAVRGNFDDAQNGVKRIFANDGFAARLLQNGQKLSSANSINWGRLLPQIVYYVAAYLELKVTGVVGEAQSVNIVVPTGNFGNILAAYYASRMGLPAKRLICASNANNILTDFIRTGIYDRQRKFEKTISPSMDILISSNLERLLFEVTGHDARRVVSWMEDLKNRGRYEIDTATRNAVKDIFWADFCTDEETIATIRDIWRERSYLLDTHTAVAVNVYQKYRSETGDKTISIIASTASPFKFASSVAQAVLEPEEMRGKDEFELMKLLSQHTGVAIPAGLQELDRREIRHHSVCSQQGMEEMVMSFLQLG